MSGVEVKVPIVCTETCPNQMYPGAQMHWRNYFGEAGLLTNHISPFACSFIRLCIIIRLYIMSTQYYQLVYSSMSLNTYIVLCM